MDTYLKYLFAVEEYPGAITYYTSSNKIPGERKTRMSGSYVSCDSSSAVLERWVPPFHIHIKTTKWKTLRTTGI